MAKSEAELRKPQTPFDGFMDLLRKVVAVPKSELDKREAAYKADRAKAKKAKKEPKTEPASK